MGIMNVRGRVKGKTHNPIAGGGKQHKHGRDRKQAAIIVQLWEWRLK